MKYVHSVALLKKHSYKTRRAHQKSTVERSVPHQESGSEHTESNCSLVASGSLMHAQASLSLSNNPYFRQASAREMPVRPAFKRCCLHLAMFIKMAAVFLFEC